MRRITCTNFIFIDERKWYRRDGEHNSAHSYLRESQSMLKKVSLVVKYIPGMTQHVVP